MKDCFDIARDIRSLIDIPEVLELLEGGSIYEHCRPANNKQIDIVIGVLGGDNEYLQNANVNILIHAPLLQGTLDGKIDRQPNLAKYNEICEVIAPLIDGQYKSSFFTFTANTGDMFRDDYGSWFCLIQVEYFSIQDKNPHV